MVSSSKDSMSSFLKGWSASSAHSIASSRGRLYCSKRWLPLAICWQGIYWFIWRRSERYWWLERVTLGLLVGAIILAGWSWGWGIVHYQGRYTHHIQSQWYSASAVMVMFVFSVTVALWAWGVRIGLLFRFAAYEKAARENPDGQCFACGYDLRGTLQAGREKCPECGQRILLEQRAATDDEDIQPASASA